MVQMNVFLGYFIKFYLVFIWFYHLWYEMGDRTDGRWIWDDMGGESAEWTLENEREWRSFFRWSWRYRVMNGNKWLRWQ